MIRRRLWLLALGASSAGHATVTAVAAADKQKLCATFDFEGLKATVVVEQSATQLVANTATWKAEFTEFDNNLCPGGQLNWHVHEYAGSGIRASGEPGNANAPGCGGDVTGGHYDPFFACGGASQNDVVGNGVCEVLRTTNQTPLGGAGNGKVLGPNYECSTDDQSRCEIGDQSGKLGKLDATLLVTVTTSATKGKKAKSSRSEGAVATTRGQQRFTDTWINPISNIEGRSLVLHCCSDAGCGPRLACANILPTILQI